MTSPIMLPSQPALFRRAPDPGTGGAQIWLKREDLNHTGAHKVNNTIGQALLASFLGKSASLPKLAPVNMVWPPPRCVPVWALNVTYSWGGQKTSSVSP